jgi:pyrophosphatase PpaX
VALAPGGSVHDGKLEAVLFDFDGTLVDTMELIYQSMRHATGEVLGREIGREQLMANVGQPLPAQMEAFDPEKVAELLEVYRLYNEEHHEALIREYPDVASSLARLQDAGLRLAVVTSKRRHSVEMALNSFSALRDVTDVFVTMEDTAEHKPRPEPLLKGLEMLGNIPPGRAAYVGDAPFDVMAARAAGTMSVAVSWGAFSEDVLREAGPDHLASNLDGAVDFLLGEAAGVRRSAAGEEREAGG